MYDTSPRRLEAVFVQRDEKNSYFSQINISGSDLIVYLNEEGKIDADKVLTWASKYGIGSGGMAISSSYASSSLSASYALTSSYTLTASYIGEGTDNYIPKWSSNTLTSTSSIYDDNSGVSIGFNSPSLTSKLTVSGSISSSADSYFNNVRVGRGCFNHIESTAIGNGALQYEGSNGNYTASFNTAIGYKALQGDDGGEGGSSGSRNVAVGPLTLNKNTAGSSNIAIGYSALTNNKGGSSNVALGPSALFYNSEGGFNIGIGAYALFENQSSSYNTAIGGAALETNTNGNLNTAIGYSALRYNTLGIVNTAVGNNALLNNVLGSTNTAVGNQALMGNISGSVNTAIGFNALTGVRDGNWNVGIGAGAGEWTNTGSNNIFIGAFAGSGSAFRLLNNVCLIGASVSSGWNVKVGLGVETAPTNTLHITGSNPLRLEGLTTVANGTLLVTDANGVVYNSSLGSTASYAISASYALSASDAGYSKTSSYFYSPSGSGAWKIYVEPAYGDLIFDFS